MRTYENIEEYAEYHALSPEQVANRQRNKTDEVFLAQQATLAPEGLALRRIREMMGETRQEFADRIGVQYGCLYGAEMRGGGLSVSSLREIMTNLPEVNVGAIVFYDNYVARQIAEYEALEEGEEEGGALAKEILEQIAQEAAE